MSIEEAQKNSWTTALHRDDVEACFSKWSEAVLHGSNYEDQRRFRDIKTGEFRWHLGRAVPIRDSNNNIVKWFGTCTDIHDQKIAEEEKQSALVGEKLARENSRIKTEFLAMMSHEIRTPLNSVIGMSEILLDSSLDSDQYECAETIRNSGETLLAIISDVLDLSKIEAGHLEIERIDFDLKKIIRELQQESSWAASQKGIEFRVLVSSDVPGIVNGDMTRTRQILSNLVSNAIKFTHEGAVILKVERQSFNHEKSQIKFEVEDTGIGISDESLKNLFQPFSQIDSSTTRKYGGTGLGLSICKRLVELLGGAIGVKSELNRGSTFFFTVPVGNVVKNYGLINREELPELSWIRTPHVLVVEDMPINHKVLTLFLNKLGCTSQVVENGIDAIEVLTRENFDLILMDCQMPGLDGYQTTRAIRSSALMRARSVPIIATTANAISGDRERCLDAGMTDYLSKPMRLADLKKKILTCLDSSFFSKGRYSFSENEIHESSSFTDKDEIDVIDWKLLGEIIGEAGSVVDNVTEILNLFKSNLPNKIQSLKLALELKDVRGIIRESHAIKSSSSYVGAKHVSKICDEIKTASSREDFLECQRLNVLLVDQLNRAVHALEGRFP